MKYFKNLLVAIFSVILLNSCATVFGGPVSSYQKTKPAPGQPQRDVRVGAMIADILLFLPGLAVDFGTGAIYKPGMAPAPVQEAPPREENIMNSSGGAVR